MNGSSSVCISHEFVSRQRGALYVELPTEGAIVEEKTLFWCGSQFPLVDRLKNQGIMFRAETSKGRCISDSYKLVCYLAGVLEQTKRVPVWLVDMALARDS